LTAQLQHSLLLLLLLLLLVTQVLLLLLLQVPGSRILTRPTQAVLVQRTAVVPLFVLRAMCRAVPLLEAAAAEQQPTAAGGRS
jgi:hypothetical protein